MESNRIVTIVSALAAGTIAVIVALRWPRVNKVIKKAKKESLEQLKASINHVRERRLTAVHRKGDKKREEELVANKIATDTNATLMDDNGISKTSDNKNHGGNGYGEKILQFLTQNQKGSTLSELGANLGVPFVTLVQPVKKLVNQGNLRKEGKLYYLANQGPDLIPELKPIESNLQ